MVVKVKKEGEYKIFPNLFVKQVSSKHIGIYHALTREVTFIDFMKDGPLFEFFQGGETISLKTARKCFKSSKKILNKLIENKIFVEKKYDYKKHVEEIKNSVVKKNPELAIGYFLLSDKCNLACKYCFIMNGMNKGYKRQHMNEDVAFESALYFSENVRRDIKAPPRVIFYGGEPLLNFEVLKLIVKTIRKHEKLNKFKVCSSMSINTNGTLITKEIAKFLKKANISVGLSIDGFKVMHDAQRKIATNKQGSFDKTLQGYNLLTKEGVDVGVSFTLNQNNIEHIEEIADYFHFKLKTRSVGVNFLNSGYQNNKNTSLDNIDKECQSVFDMFKACRKNGIREDRIARHLNKNEKLIFYPYDCAAGGNQLVFAPNGDIGVCHGYLGSRKYFFDNIFNKKNYLKSKTIRLWQKQTPLAIAECLYCPAITICGGGCALEAEVASCSIFGRYEKQCVYQKKYFIPWYIDFTYEKYLRDTF